MAGYRHRDAGKMQTGMNARHAGAAIIVVAPVAGIAVAILPGIVSVFVAAKRIDASSSALIGAAELGGITVAMFASSLCLGRFDRRLLAFLAAVMIGIGQSLSAWMSGLGAILAARLIVGVAEGALVSVVTATIGATAQPERLFGINFAVNLVVAAAFYALLPDLQSLGGPAAVMGLLTIVALISILALPWFPATAAAADPAERSTAGTALRAQWAAPFALLASWLLYTGMGAVWPLAGQIGIARGIESGVIARSLSLASVVGVASGLFTSWLGTRIGRAIPAALGTSGLIVAMALLLVPQSATIFAVASLSFMGWWIFNGTYYLGILSALDASGRLTALTLAVQMLGLTCGQFLSASLLRSSSYHSAIGFGIALAAVALVLIIAAARMASGARIEGASSIVA